MGKYILPGLLALTLLLACAGCRNQPAAMNDPSTNTTEMETQSGTCAVCSKEATVLLVMSPAKGNQPALGVCGSECGAQFAANPAKYGGVQ